MLFETHAVGFLSVFTFNHVVSQFGIDKVQDKIMHSVKISSFSCLSAN